MRYPTVDARIRAKIPYGLWPRFEHGLPNRRLLCLESHVGIVALMLVFGPSRADWAPFERCDESHQAIGQSFVRDLGELAPSRIL